MRQDKHDFWWMVALETSLFLSLPCWTVAAYGRPATNPVRFGLLLFGVASVATLIFHVAPALAGLKFGPLKGRFSLRVTLCLAAGYVYYAIGLTEVIARSYEEGTRLTFWVGVLSLLTIISFVKSEWKFGVVIGLTSCAAILALTLMTPLQGLWTQNHKWAEEPLQFDGALVAGLLLVSAPALVVGWRVGLMRVSVSRIWLSGMMGVVLPLCLAVSIASVMAQAAQNLYWRPSLPLGFEWSLTAVSHHLGPRVAGVFLLAVVSTVAYPALLSIVSLRVLTDGWSRSEWSRSKRMMLLVVTGLCGYFVATKPTNLHYPLDDRVQIVWAASLAITGAVAGLGYLMRRRKEPAADLL